MSSCLNDSTSVQLFSRVCKCDKFDAYFTTLIIGLHKNVKLHHQEDLAKPQAHGQQPVEDADVIVSCDGFDQVGHDHSTVVVGLHKSVKLFPRGISISSGHTTTSLFKMLML